MRPRHLRLRWPACSLSDLWDRRSFNEAEARRQILHTRRVKSSDGRSNAVKNQPRWADGRPARDLPTVLPVGPPPAPSSVQNRCSPVSVHHRARIRGSRHQSTAAKRSIHVFILGEVLSFDECAGQMVPAADGEGAKPGPALWGRATAGYHLRRPTWTISQLHGPHPCRSAGS